MEAGCLEVEVLIAFADQQVTARATEAIQAHLASCPDCRRVLAEVARQPAATPSVELRRGTELGRYRLAECLGSGGMGIVFAAEDPALHRQVAVKVSRENASASGASERNRRFAQERQILAGLEHPNIARLLDGGETPDGRSYLVMELVEGTPIDLFADTKRLSTVERLKLFRTVCEAVQFAHQRLVVHRDLKPPNLLVTSDGVPKLLDFGIAKLLEPTDAALTSTGAQPMTPAYAAPEQVKREAVTTATDVYALGVVLYELLTGVTPYRPATSGTDALLRAVRDQDPELASQAVARASESQVLAREASRARLRRALQGDVDSILAYALRKEPGKRYATPLEFADDVARHLEHRPVVARRGTGWYRAGRFVRRHRVGVALMASLAVGTVATGWAAHVARLERERAEHRFAQVRKLANTVLFEYHDRIAALPGSTSLREQLVKDALGYLDSLATEQADDGLRRELAQAFLKVGDVQGNPFSPSLGDTAGALGSYRRARALGQALVAEHAAERSNVRVLAESELKLGDALWASGDQPGAVAQYQAAIEHGETLAAWRPVEPGDLYQLSLAYGALTVPLRDEGRIDEAQAKAERALALRTGLVALRPDDESRHALAASHLSLGDLHRQRGAHRESVGDYQKAIAIFEALDPAFPRLKSDLGKGYTRLSMAHISIGDAAAALQMARRAVELSEEETAADPKNITARHALAAGLSTLGDVEAAAGDAKAALRSYGRAVSVARDLTLQDPRNVKARQDLATALFQLGRQQKRAEDLGGAERSLTEGLKLSDEVLADEPTSVERQTNVALLLIEQARIQQQLSHWGRALEAQQRALALFEALVLAAPDDAETLTNRASAFSDLGDTHAGLASRQPEHWSDAIRWHQRSKDAWLELKAKGVLNQADEGEPEGEAEAVAKCVEAQAKAQRTAPKP